MTEIFEAIRDRIRHSVLGTFSLLFLIFNWPIPTDLLTGSWDASERILQVETYLIKVGWNAWAVPLLFTVLYIILVPLVTMVSDWYSEAIRILRDKVIFKANLRWDDSYAFEKALVSRMTGRMAVLARVLRNNGAGENTIDELLEVAEALAKPSEDVKMAFERLRSKGLFT